MTFLDDDRPKKKPVHEIGEDLASLSVDELDRRVMLLRDEIARIEAERQKKAAGKQAADSLFRS